MSHARHSSYSTAADMKMEGQYHLSSLSMNLTIGFLELTLYSLDESRLAAHNFFLLF